jgi:hypothetical protein
VLLLIVAFGWLLLSVVVALAVGGMAKARDAGDPPGPGYGRAQGPTTAAARDEAVRSAV